ncbi:MAG TPA: hypothetical protein VK356_12980 [Thermomicrobiales bacterium]|nr:hypothetical protein [Thermomicrobiales bacterium]
MQTLNRLTYVTALHELAAGRGIGLVADGTPPHVVSIEFEARV